MTDIDIDFPDAVAALAALHHVKASMTVNGQRHSHPSGAYFQDIPCDPLDGLAAWNSETAATHGYFKIDFLTNTIYRGIRDEQHLTDLLATEPPWDLLNDPDVVQHLAHIGQHFDLVQLIEPRSIDELAICLALIRPGKRHLVKRPRFEIMRDIWLKTDKFHFKRSHAVAFAASIVVQLNLRVENSLVHV